MGCVMFLSLFTNFVFYRLLCLLLGLSLCNLVTLDSLCCNSIVSGVTFISSEILPRLHSYGGTLRGSLSNKFTLLPYGVNLISDSTQVGSSFSLGRSAIAELFRFFFSKSFKPYDWPFLTPLLCNLVYRMSVLTTWSVLTERGLSFRLVFGSASNFF